MEAPVTSTCWRLGCEAGPWPPRGSVSLWGVNMCSGAHMSSGILESDAVFACLYQNCFVFSLNN